VDSAHQTLNSERLETNRNSKLETRKLQLEIRNSKLPQGFTLLEVIITVFIFSIVLSTLFVSFNTILSTADAIDTDASSYEMGKNCLDRMIIDLTAVHVTRPPTYRVPDIDDPPEPYRFTGDSSQAGDETFGRLRFTALSHLPFENRLVDGIAEISYYVQETEEETYVLKRQDNLEPYPSFEEKYTDPILCRNIRSFTFTYFDAEGEAFENWDSEDEAYDRATPVAVKIALTFGDENRQLVFETTVSLPVFREKIE
jgi:general secretion pathway protein J